MINILKYYVRLHVNVDQNSLVYKAFLNHRSVLTEANYMKSILNISNYFGIKHLNLNDKCITQF